MSRKPTANQLTKHLQDVFAEEDRVANQKGTMQNWLYRNVPRPADFIGIPGTPLNLGALTRKWAGKPQLDFDVGRLSYYTAQSLGRLADIPAIGDVNPIPVD